MNDDKETIWLGVTVVALWAITVIGSGYVIFHFVHKFW